MAKKKIVGRREKADFPKLGIIDIDVKIDTGAFTSSIYCSDIKEIDSQLYCKFLDEFHEAFFDQELIFDSYSLAKVKSSNGISEERYQILTSMKFGSKVYKIELTLTDRVEMKYPVLIGRKFLKGKFIVDVSKTNKLKKRSKKK
jgi:hypothetical protein